MKKIYNPFHPLPLGLVGHGTLAHRNGDIEVIQLLFTIAALFASTPSQTDGIQPLIDSCLADPSQEFFVSCSGQMVVSNQYTHRRTIYMNVLAQLGQRGGEVITETTPAIDQFTDTCPSCPRSEFLLEGDLQALKSCHQLEAFKQINLLQYCYSQFLTRELPEFPF